VAWLSNGTLKPRDDFDMLWLFFRTLLPQVRRAGSDAGSAVTDLGLLHRPAAVQRGGITGFPIGADQWTAT